MDCAFFPWLPAAIGAIAGICCGVLLTVVVAALWAAGEADKAMPRRHG